MSRVAIDARIRAPRGSAADDQIQFSLAAFDTRAHGPSMAADREVHGRLANRQVAHADLFESFGHDRVREHDLAIERIDGDAEHGLQQQEGRASGCSLR